MSHLSASFSATIRVRLSDAPGSFARLAKAIGDAGGSFGAIDLVRVDKGTKVRDVTVDATDAEHLARIVESVRSTDGVEVERVSDRTFLMHLGGKIEMQAKVPVKTRDDLSMAYTPGVARICVAIADDPDCRLESHDQAEHRCGRVRRHRRARARRHRPAEQRCRSWKARHSSSRSSAASTPGHSASIRRTRTRSSRSSRGSRRDSAGINLEDISAPRCFEIEQRLRAELDIPVFHDDQHGTAIVVLAALVNALKVVGKRIEDVKVVTTGVGAAGVAVTDILLNAGVGTVIGCDQGGAIYQGREGLNAIKAAYAERTNPDGVQGPADDVLEGADVYVGLSMPGAVTREGIGRMAANAIVFAMANPTPEIAPEDLPAGKVAVVATGRSDYPNQINNVLAFPGVFRGALDVRARTITEGMKVAAGHAIASVIADDELGPEYVIPSVFNRDVTQVVAAAVAEAAERDGVARRTRS